MITASAIDIQNQVKQPVLVFPARLGIPPDRIYAGDGEFRENRQEWLQPIDLWTAIYYDHENTVTINSRTLPVKRDSIVVFAPGVRAAHGRIDAGTDHLYLSFNLPSDQGKRSAIPALVEQGHGMTTPFRRAIARVSGDLVQARAFAWGLVNHIALDPIYLRSHEALYAAEEFIARNLKQEIRVPEIADFAEVSHRHLLRMFREEHRMTVQEFIRKRRVQEACRLLTTTSRPIKQIAETVGVPELSQFNRLVKSETGVAPSAFRQIALDARRPS